MAITMVSKKLHVGHLNMGQNGRVETWGTFAFSTTDASGLIQCGLRQIEFIDIQAIQAPNTDEQMYVATANINGVILPTAGAITIARTGTKTSGLQFMIRMRGFSS